VSANVFVADQELVKTADEQPIAVVVASSAIAFAVSILEQRIERMDRGNAQDRQQISSILLLLMLFKSKLSSRE